jgi:hypothetical protein
VVMADMADIELRHYRISGLCEYRQAEMFGS